MVIPFIRWHSVPDGQVLSHIPCGTGRLNRYKHKFRMIWIWMSVIDFKDMVIGR